jgi:hypothetical protein
MVIKLAKNLITRSRNRTLLISSQSQVLRGQIAAYRRSDFGERKSSLAFSPAVVYF